jgi:hypothetical protein
MELGDLVVGAAYSADVKVDHHVATMTRVDPTGRCFISYRRSRAGEIDRLLGHLHEHGIPTWHDRANLGSEPTVEAIESAIEHNHTSSGLVWVTRDVAASAVILQEEAPRLLKRGRARNGFRTHAFLADGLDHGQLSAVLAMPGTVEDPTKTWNVLKVRGNPVQDEGAVEVAMHVMRQRLRDVHAHMPVNAPLRLKMFAHAQATPAFELGYGLALDWTPHYDHRHVAPAIWETRLLPALERVRSAVRSECPGRAVIADGHMTVATAVALGRAFSETTGLSLAWRQLPSGAHWSLADCAGDSGLAPTLASHDVSGTDLAVLVSIRGNVAEAVRVSRPVLPPFRAILTIGAHDGSAHVSLDTPGKAGHAARTIGNAIREARQRFPVVQRTHLFMSGPAGVALMVGQQLNAVGPVHLYEHDQSSDAVGRYVPSAVLTDIRSKP